MPKSKEKKVIPTGEEKHETSVITVTRITVHTSINPPQWCTRLELLNNPDDIFLPRTTSMQYVVCSVWVGRKLKDQPNHIIRLVTRSYPEPTLWRLFLASWFFRFALFLHLFLLCFSSNPWIFRRNCKWVLNIFNPAARAACGRTGSLIRRFYPLEPRWIWRLSHSRALLDNTSWTRWRSGELI